MRFNYTAMVFSLLFALGIVFNTFGMEASASHGDGTGITAEQVAADPGNEEKMRAFLDHIFRELYTCFPKTSPKPLEKLFVDCK